MITNRKGNKVLIECDLQHDNVGRGRENLIVSLRDDEVWEDFIHPHPGVSIADLMELAEIVYKEEYGLEITLEQAEAKVEHERKLKISRAVHAVQNYPNSTHWKDIDIDGA